MANLLFIVSPSTVSLYRDAGREGDALVGGGRHGSGGGSARRRLRARLLQLDLARRRGRGPRRRAGGSQAAAATRCSSATGARARRRTRCAGTCAGRGARSRRRPRRHAPGSSTTASADRVARHGALRPPPPARAELGARGRQPALSPRGARRAARRRTPRGTTGSPPATSAAPARALAPRRRPARRAPHPRRRSRAGEAAQLTALALRLPRTIALGVVVAALDGRLTVREALDAADTLAAEGLPALRDLVARGFLVEVGHPAVHAKDRARKPTREGAARMAEVEPQIRNVAVVGHRGTGKTSLVEAMLFQSGARQPARHDRGRARPRPTGTRTSAGARCRSSRALAPRVAGPQDQPDRRAGRPGLPGRRDRRAARRRGRARSSSAP